MKPRKPETDLVCRSLHSSTTQRRLPAHHKYHTDGMSLSVTIWLGRVCVKSTPIVACLTTRTRTIDNLLLLNAFRQTNPHDHTLSHQLLHYGIHHLLARVENQSGVEALTEILLPQHTADSPGQRL